MTLVRFKKIISGLAWIILLYSSASLAAEPVAETALANSSTAQVLPTIPVLCYHRFGNYPANDPYAITVETFKRQLEIIAEEGYTPVSVAQLLSAWQQGTALPDKPVLITVDDGYKDFIRNAEPALLAKHYPAVLFVYTCFVGSRYGFTQANLKELEAAGFEIGSHSATHPKLTKRPADETPEARQLRLQQELAESRKKLMEWSGGKVLALGYPYGLWDQDVARAAEAAGYELMFTVNPGTNTSRTPRFALKRYLILHGIQEKTFRGMLKVKELELASLTPAEGERAQGPITQMQATLAPEMLDCIDSKSLRVKRGSNYQTLTFDPKTHTMVITLDRPWHYGADLMVLTAQGEKKPGYYEQSWLMIVDPATREKGK